MEKSNLNIIQSQEEYDFYLVYLEKIMNDDPEPKSEIGKAINEIISAVEEYEKRMGWSLE